MAEAIGVARNLEVEGGIQELECDDFWDVMSDFWDGVEQDDLFLLGVQEVDEFVQGVEEDVGFSVDFLRRVGVVDERHVQHGVIPDVRGPSGGENHCVDVIVL